MKLITIFLLFILLVSPSLATIGISHEPLVDRQLELPRGENYLFKLTYQNTEEEPVQANISVVSDIAELVGPGLATIPAQSTNKFSLINISVPANAQINDTYSVQYLITPITQESGQVPLSFRYDRTIRVVVVEGDAQNAQVPLDDLVGEEESSNYLLVGFGVVALFALLAVFLWRKSRQVTRKAKNPFVFADGKKAHSLRQLRKHIKNKPEIIEKHVRTNTNDFSPWIEHELKNKKLAARLHNKITADDILATLA